MKQNLASLDIKLSPEDLEEVRKIAVAADATHGTRYPAEVMHLIFADTPPLKE